MLQISPIKCWSLQPNECELAGLQKIQLKREIVHMVIKASDVHIENSAPFSRE